MVCKAQPCTFQASLNRGVAKKIRCLPTIHEDYIRIPVPNIRTSHKDLQFAEASSRSCEVQGLSQFLLGDVCQHRPSADFAFEDFFKDINPLLKGSLEKERISS